MNTRRKRHTQVHLCRGSWPDTPRAHTSETVARTIHCAKAKYSQSKLQLRTQLIFSSPKIRTRNLEMNSEIIMFRFAIFSAGGTSHSDTPLSRWLAGLCRCTGELLTDLLRGSVPSISCTPRHGVGTVGWWHVEEFCNKAFEDDLFVSKKSSPSTIGCDALKQDLATTVSSWAGLVPGAGVRDGSSENGDSQLMCLVFVTAVIFLFSTLVVSFQAQEFNKRQQEARVIHDSKTFRCTGLMIV